MAIQDSFSLSNAVNSQSYAYKCWYNYNYGNNTMGISAKDMGEITQTWNSQLSNWRATALDDENAYEIEDDDFSTAKMNGKNQAKDATSYDGKKGGMIARGTVDAVASITGAVGSILVKKAATKAATEVAEIGAKKVITNVGSKVVAGTTAKFVNKSAQKVAEKAAEKATEEAAKKATTKEAAEQIGKEAAEEAIQETSNQVGKNVGKSVGCIVGCTIGLATATAYMAKKPNKDEKEACDALQDEMNNATAALGDAQNEMSDMRDEIETLSDDAQMANEDANGEIEDKKSEYDFYKASYDALMEKVNSGEQLTDDEKELLKELVPIMQQLGVDIADTQEETTDTVGEIYGEMETYQEGYDNAAETVAEVQGLTDYAESFDSATQTMCYVEAGAQTLNAASSGKSSYEAFALANSGSWFFGATAWAYAFGVMGATGAAMSGVGAAEQMDWAGKVGTEIGMRKDTQDLNAATNDIYAESIDIYDGQMGVVNDLEIEMPDDLADPEAVAESLNEETAGVLNGDGASSDTGLGVSTQAAGATGGSKPATNTAGAQDDKDKDKKVV